MMLYIRDEIFMKKNISTEGRAGKKDKSEKK